MRDAVASLTKPQLLAVIETLPQGYWPPRPTRQDKATLAEVVRRAVREGTLPIEALQAAWDR